MTAEAPDPRPESGPGPGGRDGRRRLLVVVALVVAIGLIGIAVVGPRLGPTSSLDPSAPAVVPPMPSIAPPVATERPIADVPADIDPTGATDVTAELQAFFDTSPNGSRIRLAAGATYRADGILRLDGRSDLELDGAGATIRATTIVDENRRNLNLRDARRIWIHDLTLQGVNPDPGVLDEEHQFEHGIWIDGGSDIAIERVTIVDPRGDCLYLGVADGTLPWVERVTFVDSGCRGAGRNGVAIVGARDVRIEGNTFERIGLHVIDIEPNRTDGREGTPARPVQGAADVAVVGNRVTGPIAQYFVAANGWGEIDGLTVRDNTLLGAGLRITVQPLEGSGYVRSRILVSGNRSDTAYEAGRNGAAMRFTRAIDLTVRDNDAIVSGEGAVLVELRASCRVDVGGNRFSGIVQELRGAPGDCPVVEALEPLDAEVQDAGD